MAKKKVDAKKRLKKGPAPRVLFRRLEEGWLAEISRILSSDSTPERKIFNIKKMSETAPDEHQFYSDNPGNTLCPPVYYYVSSYISFSCHDCY
jgi:hypothetical protein